MSWSLAQLINYPMKYLNKSLMLSFLDSRTTPDRPTGETRPTGGTLIVTTDPSLLGVGREVRSPESLVTSERVRAIVGGLQIGGGNLIDHLRLGGSSFKLLSFDLNDNSGNYRKYTSKYCILGIRCRL